MKCRACMLYLKEGDQFHSLRCILIYELYTKTIGVEINQALPGSLCEECFQFCVKVQNYKARCHVSERILLREAQKTAIHFDSVDISKCFDDEYFGDNPEEDTYFVVDVIDKLDESIENEYKHKKLRIQPDNDTNYFTTNNQDLDAGNETSIFEIEVISDDGGNDMEMGESAAQNENDNKNNYRIQLNSSPVQQGIERTFEDDDDFVWPQTVPDDVLFARTYEHKYRKPGQLIIPLETVYRPCVECGKLLNKGEEKEHYARWPTDFKVVVDAPYFNCDQCNAFSSYNKCAVKLHIVSRHANGQMCSICGLFFTNALCHEFSHANEIATCTLCGQKLVAQQLKRHMDLHMGKGRRPKTYFLCDICNKKIDTGRKRLHLEMHSGIKRHKCTYCDCAFRSQSDLRDHVDIHTKALRYNCQFCGEKMTRMQRRFHEKKCEKRNSTKPTRQRRGAFLIIQDNPDHNDKSSSCDTNPFETEENDVTVGVSRTENVVADNDLDINDDLFNSIFMDEE